MFVVCVNVCFISLFVVCLLVVSVRECLCGVFVVMVVSKKKDVCL